LEELNRLHQKYPEKEVREELTKSLVNVILCYGRVDIFDLMKRHLEELCQFYENYSEPNVRVDLARGLVNAISTCGYKADLGYEKFLLLYKLRFDLPNDSRKNKIINDIQIIFIKETESALRMKNEDSNLRQFISNVKIELGDEADFILLSAIKNLPIELQKRILFILNS
jgi:hypothetical protein